MFKFTETQKVKISVIDEVFLKSGNEDCHHINQCILDFTKAGHVIEVSRIRDDCWFIEINNEEYAFDFSEADLFEAV